MTLATVRNIGQARGAIVPVAGCPFEMGWKALQQKMICVIGTTPCHIQFYGRLERSSFHPRWCYYWTQEVLCARGSSSWTLNKTLTNGPQYRVHFRLHRRMQICSLTDSSAKPISFLKVIWIRTGFSLGVCRRHILHYYAQIIMFGYWWYGILQSA